MHSAHQKGACMNSWKLHVSHRPCYCCLLMCVYFCQWRKIRQNPGPSQSSRTCSETRRICEGRQAPRRFISAVKMLQTALPLGVCSACGVPEWEEGKQAHWGLALGSCHTAEDVPVLWSLAYQKVKYSWCPTWIPISSASVTHAGVHCLIGKAATLSCFRDMLMKKPDILFPMPSFLHQRGRFNLKTVRRMYWSRACFLGDIY